MEFLAGKKFNVIRGGSGTESASHVLLRKKFVITLTTIVTARLMRAREMHVIRAASFLKIYATDWTTTAMARLMSN
tara:strand:- start:500 stop:727 length:228 start_codon:yes stop_codon:yes gene_type:complete